jgi:hypothetical protein
MIVLTLWLSAPGKAFPMRVSSGLLKASQERIYCSLGRRLHRMEYFDLKHRVLALRQVPPSARRHPWKRDESALGKPF